MPIRAIVKCKFFRSEKNRRVPKLRPGVTTSTYTTYVHNSFPSLLACFGDYTVRNVNKSSQRHLGRVRRYPHVGECTLPLCVLAVACRMCNELLRKRYDYNWPCPQNYGRILPLTVCTSPPLHCTWNVHFVCRLLDFCQLLSNPRDECSIPTWLTNPKT